MKRFWDTTTVVQDRGRYAIRLDGRPMRLPGGPVLALESERLARAIADEWSSAGGRKGGDLQAEDVPLTRIAGTAQERVAPDPRPTIDALLKFGETDLLCYEADGPQELVRRQEALWLPWLDWADRTYGARLARAHGVMPITQTVQAVAALRAALTPYPAFVLAGLGVLVPATGSLVLGLAVADGALSGADAHALAVLDETFQAEKWGEDREAALRRRNVAIDVELAARFIGLCTPQ